jgi:hypothetical protein
MARRADLKRNEARVTRAVLRAPTATQAEIARMAWISQTTVNKHIQKIEKKVNKDDRILALCEDDFSIVRLAQWIIKDKLTDKKQVAKMRAVEVSQVARDSTARYTLFVWPATDQDWGLNVRDMSDTELTAYILKLGG